MLRNVVTNNVFLNEKVKTQQQQNKKSNRSQKLNPAPLVPKADALPQSQLRVSIVVKLFNCFDAMGRNVNKQSRICGPHIINKFIFSVILLHA